jgi:hypothetical protein
MLGFWVIPKGIILMWGVFKSMRFIQISFLVQKFLRPWCYTTANFFVKLGPKGMVRLVYRIYR